MAAVPARQAFQLAVCDLDGTLLGPDKRISAANAAAVRTLQARGMHVVLASGRREQNSLRYYRELNLSGPLISCAGARVADPSSGEVLREEPLPAPLAAELVASGEAAGFSVVYYHREHLFVARRGGWIDLYESRVEERAEIIDLATLHGDAALKIVWYGEPAALGRGRAEWQERYAGRASIIATDPENLEFAAPAANKGKAMAAVARSLGIDQQTTVAFGDGENDVPMLQWASLGVAMDRGPARQHCPGAVVAPAGDPAESFARAVDLICH